MDTGKKITSHLNDSFDEMNFTNTTNMSYSVYRARYNRRDLWTELSENWLHFFWLTGETPETCRILVRSLQRNDGIFRHVGRSSCLDFRNQVNIQDKFVFSVSS